MNINFTYKEHSMKDDILFILCVLFMLVMFDGVDLEEN